MLVAKPNQHVRKVGSVAYAGGRRIRSGHAQPGCVAMGCGPGCHLDPVQTRRTQARPHSFRANSRSDIHHYFTVDRIGSCRSRIRLPVVPASIRRRLRRITPTAAARAAPSKAIRKPPRNLQLHSTPRRRVRRRCHPWTPRPRQRRLRRGARCSESLGTERRSDSWPGGLTRARRW